MYMSENRPNRPLPRNRDWFPKNEVNSNEKRIRDLEKAVAELRRYKEEQEEKENPKVRKYRKRPLEIEALRYTTVEALKKAFPDVVICVAVEEGGTSIQTLEGRMDISF